MQQRKKIEKMLFSDEDTDDDKSDEEAPQTSPSDDSETSETPAENAALVAEETQEDTGGQSAPPVDSQADSHEEEMESAEQENQLNNDSDPLSPVKTERDFMEVEKNPLEISTLEELEEEDPLEDPLNVDTEETIEKTAEDNCEIKQEKDSEEKEKPASTKMTEGKYENINTARDWRLDNIYNIPAYNLDYYYYTYTTV